MANLRIGCETGVILMKYTNTVFLVIIYFSFFLKNCNLKVSGVNHIIPNSPLGCPFICRPFGFDNKCHVVQYVYIFAVPTDVDGWYTQTNPFDPIPSCICVRYFALVVLNWVITPF